MRDVLTDDELFRRVRRVIRKDWIEIPKTQGFGGTGAPGRLLEHELGLDGGKLDIPDAGKWELKFHGGKSLLTLFHKEGRPRGHMHHLVRHFGIMDKLGRLSFRHTIKARSDLGFYVANESNLITVRNAVPNDIVWPHWSHDDLITAFAAKLRRVIVVKGERRSGLVKYRAAHAYEEPSPTRFIEAIANGTVAIDFDARTTNGEGLRNHGTKFRIEYDDLGKLYRKRTRI